MSFHIHLVLRSLLVLHLTTTFIKHTPAEVDLIGFFLSGAIQDGFRRFFLCSISSLVRFAADDK